MEAKLVDIGNSKGVRLPKKIIKKYNLQDKLTLLEKKDGILIKANDRSTKLSWEETYKKMAQAKEDWSAFDTAVSDGIK